MHPTSGVEFYEVSAGARRDERTSDFTLLAGTHTIAGVVFHVWRTIDAYNSDDDFVTGGRVGIDPNGSISDVLRGELVALQVVDATASKPLQISSFSPTYSPVFEISPGFFFDGVEKTNGYKALGGQLLENTALELGITSNRISEVVYDLAMSSLDDVQLAVLIHYQVHDARTL